MKKFNNSADTIEEFCKNFKALDDVEPNGVRWITTWGLGFVDDRKLMKLFELALPYEVITPANQFYDNYSEIHEWLKENSIGLWTHFRGKFKFEKEEDAMAFKLKWL